MSLYKKALLKADEVRATLGINIFDPINIFDACHSIGISVRFMDVSMEGLYVAHHEKSKCTILISSLRPLPRRCFTCAHELGHHVFGHGMKLDTLLTSSTEKHNGDLDEQLVDYFAGALLMPIAGVLTEFSRRGLKIEHASAIDFYTVASVFGVGYRTLVTHCKINNLLSGERAVNLMKQTPSKILKTLFNNCGNELSHFKIIDCQSAISTVDLETGDYLIVPQHAIIEGTSMMAVGETDFGVAYKAKYSGISRGFSTEVERGFFVRIQKKGYVGLAEFRHLEVDER